MSDFGDMLRTLRRNTTDPLRGGMLTQARMVDLLQQMDEEVTYSTQAYAMWEAGKRKIHADNRPLLIAIIQALVSCDSISTVDEANKLLRAGWYSELHSAEIAHIEFSKESLSAPSTADTDKPILDADVPASTKPVENKYSHIVGSDSLSAYLRGIEQVINLITEDHPTYLVEVLGYQQQMRETIAATRQFGDTPTDRARRAEIVARLNRICLQTIGRPFNQLL